MQKRFIFILVTMMVVVALGAVYNSHTYKAMFDDQFYQDIFREKFDVTSIGSAVTIPLNNKFNTEHGFTLSIPRTQGDYSAPDIKLDGELQYRFIKKNGVVKGIFTPLKKRYSRVRNERIVFDLFYFDLPYDDEPVLLEIIVISPITALKDFKGQIYGSVAPSYSVKNGEQKERLGIYY